MQIIRDLEPAPRGVYCGAIGLLRPGGDCVFNVPIRTLVRERSDAARVHVGGGITWDSRAGGEYAECLDKLAFLDDPEDFHIIEALLWEDGSYFLLERHLDRMAEAAAHFGRRFDHDAARELLADTGRAAPDPAKVRLMLDRAGTLAAEAVFIDPTTPTQRVAFAGQPVDSADPALARKTTRREIYKRALAAAGDVDDVILWNERGEATESTRANLVVELEGRLYTPPVACGLLPGTFRAELVERGEVAERVLTLEDVRQARALWLVNSVRRWMAAELAD
jgi:para-aminobenzoate synthetase/4-amino-4-deoxychorismate lyase